ncbi:MAG: hypothetical protein K2O39_02840 [Clostridiales bacterium]|nr:hypothetical protein [Clostridiales bacterium]
MKNKNRKLLKKEIKQIKAVIGSFNYKYFAPLETEMSDEALKKFEKFRSDTLFKLVDQWKKMELELMEMDGRLRRPLRT